MKLEKVEYAGIKGRMLSAQTVAIYEEFNEMYKTFQEVTYDPLDPQDTVSDRDGVFHATQAAERFKSNQIKSNLFASISTENNT